MSLWNKESLVDCFNNANFCFRFTFCSSSTVTTTRLPVVKLGGSFTMRRLSFTVKTCFNVIFETFVSNKCTQKIKNKQHHQLLIQIPHDGHKPFERLPLAAVQP